VYVWTNIRLLNAEATMGFAKEEHVKNVHGGENQGGRGVR
jgi:hypothetical protein